MLDYLAEEDSPRTATDLNMHFAKKIQGGILGYAYDWLADHGFIRYRRDGARQAFTPQAAKAPVSSGRKGTGAWGDRPRRAINSRSACVWGFPVVRRRSP